MIEELAIPLNVLVVQEAGNIVSDMDGEKVMLNITNGNYYNLGQIGGRIWELLENAVTVGELVGTLLAEYDVDRAKCEEHVQAFLQHLRNEKLIRIGEAV